MVRGRLEIPLEKSGARGFQKNGARGLQKNGARKMGPEVCRKMGPGCHPILLLSYITTSRSNDVFCQSEDVESF